MKKFLSIFVIAGLITGVLSVFFSTVAFANATIDTSKTSNGYVTVNLSGGSENTIKAQVEKGSEKYVYTLIKNSVNLPLQMGTGEYTVSIMENVTGNNYKMVATEKVNVASIDEKEMYKISMPQIEYSVSTKAIPKYKELTGSISDDKEKATALYEDIIRAYEYDFNKAATVKNGYVPVIDSVYDAKKGICYDYAAVFGGALRSQGVPTKLVMGYIPDLTEYHAWNEVLIGGKWVAIDTTYDAQVVAAGLDYTMEKDISKTKVLKVY